MDELILVDPSSNIVGSTGSPGIDSLLEKLIVLVSKNLIKDAVVGTPVSIAGKLPVEVG